MGSAAAWTLARDGHDVVVYEQFRIPHARGSSHGRTRIFRLAYPEPEWVRHAQEALVLWRELEVESGETLLDLHGLLELYRDPAQSSAAALAAIGAAFELLDGAETERRFGIRIADGLTALFQPDAGVSYAERAQRAFLDGARARGATLLEETRIESLDDVEAEVVVVTAGPWVSRFFPDLQVVPTRETVAYFRLRRRTPPPSVISELAHGFGFYALADPVHGLKVGHHKTGAPADPDVDGGPDEATLERVTGWARARFDLDEPDPVATDTCFYTSTVDESFVLERRGRVVVGSACSGHGFKFAPAVGRRLADLAAGSIL